MGSAGGIATAIKSRKLALDGYYENPNLCLNCGCIIHVRSKVSGTRKNKFCSRSCAAKYNNKKRNAGKESIKKHCPICGKVINKKSKACIKHTSIIFWSLQNGILDITKGQLKERRGAYQSWRSTISNIARNIYRNSDLPKECCVCGYDNNFDVCHIKAVSDFADDATIGEINNLSNLIALCPNHHWEYDNGLLDKITLESILK
jgi:hypothetical protein